MVDSVLGMTGQQLAEFCVNHHIQRLALYGSQVNGNARQESDIDILVEFDPGEVPGLLGIAEIEHELSALAGGKAVDVRTPGDLSPYFRDEAIRSSQVQYAR